MSVQEKQGHSFLIVTPSIYHSLVPGDESKNGGPKGLLTCPRELLGHLGGC